MTIRGLISILSQQEDLNFLLTNRVPRAALTRFMGWFSKIEQPLVRDLSIANMSGEYCSVVTTDQAVVDSIRIYS